MEEEEIGRGEEVLQCCYCRGRVVRGKTTYTLNGRGYHLLVDEVPAWVCGQCGEVYFEGDEVDDMWDLVRA